MTAMMMTRDEEDGTIKISIEYTMMDDSESTVSTNLKQDSRFNCNICLDPVTEPVVTRCGHLYCWPCLFRWLEPGIRSEEALSSWNNFTLAPTVDESRRCCPVCKAECSIPTLVPIYVRNEPGTPLAAARKRSPPAENHHSREEQNVSQEDSSSVHSFGGNEQEQAAEEMTTENSTTTGLRQRLRFRSRDSEIPDIPPDDNHVPSRPTASPARPSNTSVLTQPRAPQATAAAAFPARPPLSPHQASLSHGMLLMFQQALNSTDAGQQRGVPPLHHGNDGDDAHAFGNTRGTVESPAARDDATEFLSRLILILASFIILCLLLF